MHKKAASSAKATPYNTTSCIVFYGFLTRHSSNIIITDFKKQQSAYAIGCCSGIVIMLIMVLKSAIIIKLR